MSTDQPTAQRPDERVETCALSLRNITAGYGRVTVLHGVDLDIHVGESVGVVGHNGAGKSTMLKVMAGVLKATGGSVTFPAAAATGARPPRRAMVPQGLAVFPRMTVRQNLLVPGLNGGSAARTTSVEDVVRLFPILGKREKELAGNLSGGEQQMLAMAMALRLSPDILLLDEPSLGLAPLLVEQIMKTVDEVRREFNCAVVTVEQNVDALMRHADRLVVVQQGRIVWTGPTSQMSNTKDLWQYF